MYGVIFLRIIMTPLSTRPFVESYGALTGKSRAINVWLKISSSTPAN